jgi:hypothetical protein
MTIFRQASASAEVFFAAFRFAKLFFSHGAMK